MEGKREYDKNPEYYNEILNNEIDILNNLILEQIEAKDCNIIRYNETSFDNFRDLTYGHDGLLEIAYSLFKKYNLLGRILQDKYDFIFIDEYQDTNPKIIEIFFRLLPSYKKTIIGLFGDSMQAIYEDGIGDVENYIKEGSIIKIIKEDNYRCSEQVVQFINQLRNDDLEQQVAFKMNKDDILETKDDRQGTVKLYYGIYDNKPNAFSSIDHKHDYMEVLNKLVEEANRGPEDFRILMLTNKSISGKAGFENLYDIFSARYFDPKDTIDKHLLSLQLLELVELCNAYKSNNYNYVLSKIKKYGYSVRYVRDKVEIKKNFNKILESTKGALDTLELAFESKLLKRSEKFSEYLRRKDTFLSQLKENEEYIEFKFLYQKGNNTYSKMSKATSDWDEDEFKELERNLLKENFYVDLFSKKIKFNEIINYYDYMNEKTKFITMHKTKGSGIDNVLVVLDEYFWNAYDFKSIFCSSDDNEKKKHKNQKLIYVACSRAKVNLTCVKLISKDEEQDILKWFKEAVKVEVKQEQLK
nr:UvrD-helicase domain-containing protein [Paenibacillus silagei]